MQPVNTFRRSRLAASIGLVLGSVSLGAIAQEVEDQEAEQEVVEEVIVSGYRASLQDSVATKRDNNGIVEAISSEDLGKLPDVSIAEGLGRLPGLTVQRLNGRAQVVAVRGMSPDFSTGLLNGREQVSVGDNRGVEFDQYPSELLNAVTVYKTPNAGLIGQGLSGTVDLQTVRPLDESERRVVVSGRYEQLEYDLASNRGSDGNRLNAVYVDQFSDDTIGLMLGYSHTDSSNQGQHFNSWGYYAGDGQGNNAIGGGRVYVRTGEFQRDSFVSTVEFRPSDNFGATFDLFYSDFTEDNIKHGLALCLACGATLTTIEAQNGIVTEGIYDGVKTIVENNQFKRDADSLSLGLNFDFQITDGWTGEIDLSHSSVDRKDLADLETNMGTGPAGQGAMDTVHFWSSPNGTQFETMLDYSNADYGSSDPLYVTSPQGWGDPNALAAYNPAGQFGYNKIFDINDEINAFRASTEGELNIGPLTTIEIGVNYTERSKSRIANEGVVTDAPNSSGAYETQTQLPAGLAGAVSLDFALNGANTNVLAYDPSALLKSGEIIVAPYAYNDIAAKGWTVDEEVMITYVQANLETDVAGMNLYGNFGFQYHSWDQSSNGEYAIGSGSNYYSEKLSYSASDSEVLPSLNLNLAVTEDLIVRFGAAKTLARPRMDEMRASGYYGYDAGKDTNNQADIDAAIAGGTPEFQAYQNLSPWNRNSGNTMLTPWLSTGYDFSTEYYFEDGLSYVSAAYFYKELDSYIFNQASLYDFNGIPVTTVPNPQSDITVGPTYQPMNGEGGEIKGYELTASINFGLFADVMQGFGVFATYSNTESDIEPNGPGSNSRLPGLSEDVYNVTVYYDDHGWNARVSQRYRSDFVGEVTGFGGARTGSDVMEETILDAQIGYTFQYGTLEGLSVTLQGLNLTNEPFRTVDVGTGYATEYQTYGATYSLGASYSF